MQVPITKLTPAGKRIVREAVADKLDATSLRITITEIVAPSWWEKLAAWLWKRPQPTGTVRLIATVYHDEEAVLEYDVIETVALAEQDSLVLSYFNLEIT